MTHDDPEQLSLLPDARLARIPPYLRPRRALARTTDVETSHHAVPPATRRRTQMLSIMRLYNDDPRGLTADACSVLLGDEVWRRVSDLRSEGLLTWLLDDDDRPVKRPARSGRDARVLVRVLDPL